MKVVLIRKLAKEMDGVNVARHTVGDVLDLPPREANMLIAEQWATPERRHAQAAIAGPDRRARV
jgi:hypothetical protein